MRENKQRKGGLKKGNRRSVKKTEGKMREKKR